MTFIVYETGSSAAISGHWFMGRAIVLATIAGSSAEVMHFKYILPNVVPTQLSPIQLECRRESTGV